MEHMKVSTSRDFRIIPETLRTALEEQESSEEEEEEDNNNNQGNTTNQQVGGPTIVCTEA